MAFELPKLKYAYDALEPNIDARTLKKISPGRLEDKFGLTEKVFCYI